MPTSVTKTSSVDLPSPLWQLRAELIDLAVAYVDALVCVGDPAYLEGIKNDFRSVEADLRWELQRHGTDPGLWERAQ